MANEVTPVSGESLCFIARTRSMDRRRESSAIGEYAVPKMKRPKLKDMNGLELARPASRPRGHLKAGEDAELC
jgi:hypothetical protein